MGGIGLPARLRRLASSLAIVAASAAILAISAPADAAVSAPATGPGHTIATASQLTLGQEQSGGGSNVDFWLVSLAGGDQVQFSTDTPSGYYYTFDFYAPGTTDSAFATTVPLTSTNTNYGGTSTITLQAPYTGTFILAVCASVSGNDCSNIDNGQGANPMAAYTFTATLVGGGVSATQAAGEVQAGATIAAAPLLTIGNFEAGGGNHADFWQIKLAGGDQVQFSTDTPSGYYYTFDFYAPGTTDSAFGTAVPLTSTNTNYGGTSTITLQAPYTGTFILAVCASVSSNDCSNIDNGQGAYPVQPYTFTPTLVGGGVSATQAAGEVQAGATIAAAPLLTIGNFEAGGGNHADFWKIKLAGGDKVQFSTDTPGGYYYTLDLYAPNTTDSSFALAVPLVATNTNDGGASTLVLQAPYSGTFILAVCASVNSNDCSNVDNGQGANPMQPYTFTPTLISGPGTAATTSTRLKLSASTITYGSENSLKISVTVTSSGGTPGGTVVIRIGKKTICTVKLSHGKGTCSPANKDLLAAGKYSVVAAYQGSKGFKASSSAAVTLKVVKPKRKATPAAA